MATPDRRSAAMTYDQNTPGRLSYSSTFTQATAPGSAAAHKASAIVLPAPGGPVTTVSGHHRVPRAISSVIRGRCTVQAGTSGAVIFESRIGSPTGPADGPLSAAAAGRPATRSRGLASSGCDW